MITSLIYLEHFGFVEKCVKNEISLLFTSVNKDTHCTCILLHLLMFCNSTKKTIQI